MASQKILLLFVLVAISAAFAAPEPEEPKRFIPKDVIVGYREPKDHLIEREVISKRGRFLWYVNYQKTFVGDNHSIITQIRLIDLNTNGHGAIAKVVAGGPGHSFVTLLFRSLLNRDINFGVEIYGKEPTEEQ